MRRRRARRQPLWVVVLMRLHWNTRWLAVERVLSTSPYRCNVVHRRHWRA